jgi:hypothetical protein
MKAATHNATLGSGATFDITADGSGWWTVSVASGGADYKEGQRITIPGDSIGNAALNVLYLIVTGVDAGAITSVITDGGAGSVGTSTYSGVSGTTSIGSGATLTFRIDPATGEIAGGSTGVSTSAPYYSVGDTLTVLGKTI